MASDYSNSKPLNAPGVYPENAMDAEHQRLEPIIGFDEIVTRHLFGIPLVSYMKDPISGKNAVFTPDMVKDIIDGALQQAEIETKIDISPVKRSEKYPFDRNLYDAYGYFQVFHRPITSITKIAVTPANQQDVYILPLEWVEMANAIRGQVNIIPMTAAFIQGGFIPAGSTGGAFFLAILGNRAWIPAYWQIDYTSGYSDGMIPRIVNELIGTIAAQEILSMLAATYRISSHSMGLDGMSQSVSAPGPQLFQTRMQELEDKKKRLTNRIKALYGRKIYTSHV